MPRLEFVTFCCYDSDLFGGSGRKGEGLPRDIEIVDYLYHSIKKHHSDSSFTVITNAPAAFHGRLEGAHILEKDINPSELMYERTKCYVDYVHSAEKDSELIAFLDSDCFLIDNLTVLAAMDFDIALTCIKDGYPTTPQVDKYGIVTSKDVTASPINGGVIFTRTTAAAKRAWKDILVAYDTLADLGDEFRNGREHLLLGGTCSIKKWGGDQFALMYSFGKYLVPDFPEGSTINTVKVLFLDRREYNATPTINGSGVHFESDVKARIVHMKGPKRKQYIPALAKHYGIE